jgi:uncharacterized membrane protein
MFALYAILRIGSHLVSEVIVIKGLVLLWFWRFQGFACAKQAFYH